MNHNLLDIDESKRLLIVQETVNQIIKDFDLAGLTIDFSGDISFAYEELFSQIKKHVQQNYGNPSFMRMLNRVDISESLLRKNLKHTKDIPQVIAELIIKRELQKVVIRLNYK